MSARSASQASLSPNELSSPHVVTLAAVHSGGASLEVNYIQTTNHITEIHSGASSDINHIQATNRITESIFTDEQLEQML